MDPTEHKIGKLGAAVITRDVTLTIPWKREIFRKPGSATSQSVIMEALITGLLTMYGTKKRKEKVTCKNLSQ
jgi:hypothetical protein